MRMIRPPGVYRPQGDTALLLESLAREPLGPGARTLDLCTGTGVLAVAAARRGAEATASDISLPAVAAARSNARLHGCRVRVLHGDLAAPLAGERFDLVTVNPPYVPARTPTAPVRGRRRAWDAGHDGRLLLDRICRIAPELLARDGVLLLVQSSLSGIAASLTALYAQGLRAHVSARRVQRFGPVMAARAGWLERGGLVEPGTRAEELVVIRAVSEAAVRPSPPAPDQVWGAPSGESGSGPG
ncbi:MULTISPECIES: HemK2/MTQ2 family protein methyltransferase [unclassified Streptomyces]|uniref:HemK2/MTQ2 family protein methyltransferase n=1 Tax=unclassified Streptomyces TaxID=2593676 RepID=UPI002E30D7FB|nr:HemK2/MTQ2 family protein methyltransferase [Streptomyces sp. NBC_01268]